jgi:hypothetical protein
MYYQLPNGKTIWLDISDILDITDQDIRDLIAANAGEHIQSPWHGSSINKKRESSDYDEEDDENDDADIDYYYREYFPDEFPDGPDDLDLELDRED